MMPPSRIAELASIISSNTSQVDDYISARGLPPLSFEPNASLKPDTLPHDIQSAQNAILEATDELNALILGPEGTLRQYLVCLFYDMYLPPCLIAKTTCNAQNKCVEPISLNAINHFKVAENFPEDKNVVTYAELSNRTGLHEAQIRRMLRHTMTSRIFMEPTKDSVAHTSASRLLTSPYMYERISWFCNEIWPSATKVHSSSDLCIEKKLMPYSGRGCNG